MAIPQNDRNLLFGILALQMDFVSKDKLVAGMNAWVLAKQRPLGEILVEQGGLAADTRAMLDTLVAKHLAMHGGSVEKSLAAVAAPAHVKQELHAIKDRDIEASLAHATAAFKHDGDYTPTMAPSVGELTSMGTRFRILRPHARGGLGQVSVAHDEELHREVALKEIQNQYCDDPDNRARFLLEAEITGGLEHPGIVPVYGLGQYADGRPYYAMRFIRGDNLKEAVTRFHQKETPGRDPGERMLELRKLLSRFLDVCNAIGYAHSRGILHRDLKPGNIMLGKYGETLVVDWGLAKPVGQTDTDNREPMAESRLAPSIASVTSATQMGAAVGTPQYMSPEQAGGRLDLLGPASDIYSLGATLYYLLVGRPPFEDSDVGTVLHKVQRGEFKPPRELSAKVPPALNAVCLKAMAIRPEDRYATPALLADDIEHWLADEPVGAYREPWSARAARSIRRHKTFFSVAVVLLFTAVIALSVSTFFINRARNAAEAAQRKAVANFKMAQDAVDKYLTKIGRDQRLKAHGLEPLRKDLLQTAREFYDRFLDEKQGEKQVDPDLERSRGAAYTHLAYITSETGSKEEAVALYTHALNVYQRLAAADPKTEDYVGDAAEVQYTLGGLYQAMGKLPEAVAACHAAIAALTPVAAEHPEITRYQAILATSQSNLGVFYQGMGQPKEAEEAFLAAMKIRFKLAADHADSDDFQSDLSLSHNNLGLYYQKNGRPKEAGAEFKAALELRSHLAAKHPDVVANQNELARINYNLGVLYKAQRQFQEAEAAYQAAVKIDKRLLDEHPEVARYQATLASAYNELADLYQTMGRDKDLEDAYLAALKLNAKLAADNPQVADYQFQLADIQNNLGLLYKTEGNFAAAEKAYQAAAKLREQLAAAAPSSTANAAELGRAEFNLATLYKDTGRPDEARAAFEKSIEIRGKLAQQAAAAKSADQFAAEGDLAQSRNELGVVLTVLKRFDDAEAAFRAALEISQRLADQRPDDLDAQTRLADVLNSQGRAYATSGRMAEAEKTFDAAVAIWQRLAGTHPNVPQHDRELARVRHNQGNLFRDEKQYDKAEAAYRASFEIRKRLVEGEPTRVEYRVEMAALQQSIGGLFAAMSRPDDAARAYQRAVDIYLKLAAEHPDTPLFKTRAEENQRLAESVKKPRK